MVRVLRVLVFSCFVVGLLGIHFSATAVLADEDPLPCPDEGFNKILCPVLPIPKCFQGPDCPDYQGAEESLDFFDSVKASKTGHQTTKTTANKTCYTIYKCKTNGEKCIPDLTRPLSVVESKVYFDEKCPPKL